MPSLSQLLPQSSELPSQSPPPPPPPPSSSAPSRLTPRQQQEAAALLPDTAVDYSSSPYRITIAEQLALVPAADTQAPGLAPGPAQGPGLGPNPSSAFNVGGVIPPPRGVSFAQGARLAPGPGTIPGAASGPGLSTRQETAQGPRLELDLEPETDSVLGLAPSISAYSWADSEAPRLTPTTIKTATSFAFKPSLPVIPVIVNSKEAIRSGGEDGKMLRDDFVGAMLRQQGRYCRYCDTNRYTPSLSTHPHYLPICSPVF